VYPLFSSSLLDKQRLSKTSQKGETMKFSIILLLTVWTASTWATPQKDFTLPSDCKKAIELAVADQVGGGNETFTVEAVKLIYGGVYKGSSYPVVAIVRTSDEVDPRDVLVKTSSPANGTCVVEFVDILADGVLPEDPVLDQQ
jgi:hypothetical protein